MSCATCAAAWIVSIVGLLFIAWKVSSTARYYLKFTIFCIVSIIFATAPIPLMLFRPRSSKNALFPAAGLRWSCKLLGLERKVIGKENIVQGSGCVVLINHQSALDLIVLAELWPIMENCTVISKKEVFYLWPFGLASWLWGTIFIDRLNAEKAQDTINSTGKYIRDKEHRVLMFPEGTRSLKGKLLPFKKGAFHLAIASQCPIQPVIVKSYKFLGNNRFEEGEIRITVLPSIPTAGLAKNDISDLMDKTYKTMSNCFDKVSNEDKSNPNNNIDKSEKNL